MALKGIKQTEEHKRKRLESVRCSMTKESCKEKLRNNYRKMKLFMANNPESEEKRRMALRDFEHLRFDINNGTTLCRKCHKEMHDKTFKKEGFMKTILFLVLVCLLVVFSTAVADMTYTAVTPDGKESDINKVKVRAEVIIAPADLATIQKYNPSFKQPEAKMYRLELIDEEIAKLEKQKADVQAKINEQQALRLTVEEAAKKVILK